MASVGRQDLLSKPVAPVCNSELYQSMGYNPYRQRLSREAFPTKTPVMRDQKTLRGQFSHG